MSSFLINRLSVFALLAVTSFVWAQPSSKLQSIKEEGLALYNMHFDAEAVPLLELAAQAGDPEAQYYMGEIQRQKTMFMSLVAQRWYEKSADQGDIYAMLRLATADNTVCKLSENCASFVKTSEQWGNIARNLGRQGAAQGDGEAMFQLYLLTSDFCWLVESAEAGFPEGQNLLGLYYQEGKGIFLIPGKREKETERLFRAAAESGYVPAMGNLSGLLLARSDIKGLGYWIEAAAQRGHYGAMTSYAAWTAHMPDQVGYPLDMVKAYGLTLLLAQADPGTWRKSYGEKALDEVAALMNPEQIEAGKAFAEEWKKTHPPLSRFLPKYGY